MHTPITKIIFKIDIHVYVVALAYVTILMNNYSICFTYTQNDFSQYPTKYTHSLKQNLVFLASIVALFIKC